jgi:hypothetical protein
MAWWWSWLLTIAGLILGIFSILGIWHAGRAEAKSAELRTRSTWGHRTRASGLSSGPLHGRGSPNGRAPPFMVPCGSSRSSVQAASSLARERLLGRQIQQFRAANPPNKRRSRGSRTGGAARSTRPRAHHRPWPPTTPIGACFRPANTRRAEGSPTQSCCGSSCSALPS